MYNKLRAWKKKHTDIYPASYKNIKPEFREKAKHFYIRRSVEATEMFVDIHWYIKRSEHTPHEDYIYYRCEWSKVQNLINRVEIKELPKHINSMLEND